MTEEGEPPPRIGDEEWSEYVAGFEIPRYRQRLTRTRVAHRWHRVNLRPLGVTVAAATLLIAGALYILQR